MQMKDGEDKEWFMTSNKSDLAVQLQFLFINFDCCDIKFNIFT